MRIVASVVRERKRCAKIARDQAAGYQHRLDNEDFENQLVLMEQLESMEQAATAIAD